MFLVGWAGWALRGWQDPKDSSRVDRAGPAVVEAVAPVGTLGCVVFDGGRRECTTFAVLGDGRLGVGQHVYAAHEWTPTSDLLLVVP